MNAITGLPLSSTSETLANREPYAEVDLLTSDPSATVIEISVSQLLSNDRDPDAADVIRLLSIQPDSSGTPELVSDASGDKVVFTLPKDWSLRGTASFEYTIEDGAGATCTTGVIIFPTCYYLTKDYITSE